MALSSYDNYFRLFHSFLIIMTLSYARVSDIVQLYTNRSMYYKAPKIARKLWSIGALEYKVTGFLTL